MNAARDDKLKCLCEIAELAMSRMNTGDSITAGEAFTLGEITGIACRVPGVSEYLKDRDQGKVAKAGFGRSWPPGVHGDLGDDPDGDIEGYDGGYGER